MVASIFEINVLKYIMIYGRRRLSRAQLPYIIFSSPILYYILLIILRHFNKINRQKNKLIYKFTKFNQVIIQQCPSLQTYTAPSWLPGPHFNTLFMAFFRTNPKLSYHRTLLTLPEHHDHGYPNINTNNNTNIPIPNGTISLDWHGAPPTPGRTILLVLHGLTGGSDEAYVQHTILAAEETVQKGGLPRKFPTNYTINNNDKETITTVVMNARGCGGSSLTSPRCFSAAWTADVRYVVNHIKSIVGTNTPIVAIGFSLGAGILAKYVAEDGEDCGLTAAVACCASYDLNLSSNLLETFPNNYTYNPTLASNLRKFLHRHIHHFQDIDWLNIHKARSAQTVREFDTATIVPMFKYSTVEDYYTDASSGRILHQIKIPFLMLNSIDDPICAVGGISESNVRASDYCISVQTKEGGHVAWCQYPSRIKSNGSSSSLFSSTLSGSSLVESIFHSIIGNFINGLPITRSWDNDASMQFLSVIINNIEPKQRGGYMNDSTVLG